MSRDGARGVVQRRADVDAAREHEAVEPHEHRGGILDALRRLRQHDRDAAREPHALDVAARHQRGRHLPGPERAVIAYAAMPIRGRLLQALEPAPPLPVGDGRVERRELDAGGVGVVVDDVLAERLAPPPPSPANSSAASRRVDGTRGASAT